MIPPPALWNETSRNDATLGYFWPGKASNRIQMNPVVIFEFYCVQVRGNELEAWLTLSVLGWGRFVSANPLFSPF